MEKAQAGEDAKKSVENVDASPKMLPLHRRRFDAKQRVFPTELTDLPSASISTAKPSSRKFCEDLTERLQRKDVNTLEELQPLCTRSARIAAATLATEDAFDHLDRLYILMEQLLTLKEQNSKIQRRVRDMEHLKKIQEMHQQIEREMIRTKTLDPDSFYKSEATSMDLGEEYEYTEALLDSMLEAGRNASLKRAKWKSPSRSKLRQSIVRSQRSRSMGGEDLEACALPENDYCSHLTVPYKGRRASEAKGGDKSKISKWTRVKAAFKWEKAHTGIVGESVHPVPQRAFIPPIPFVVPTPGTPLTPIATPASVSPASSAEDMTENATCRQKCVWGTAPVSPKDEPPMLADDSARRSRSLDSSVILDAVAGPLNNEDMCNMQSNAKLHKTPWGKMKDIIQTRKESVRKKQNRNSVRSSSGCRTSENYSLSDGGGLSQSESAEILCASDKNSPKRKISGQEKGDISISELPDAAHRTTPTLTVTMPSSEELAKNNRVSSNEASTSYAQSSPQHISKSMSQPKVEIKHDRQHRVLTKQKSLELTKRTAAVRPTTLQDSSDADTASPIIHRHDSKWKKVKKAFLTSTSASTPSSPSRNSAFFSYEPEDIQNEIPSQRMGLEDEIKRDYEALQNRLSKEFYDKVVEWSSGGTGSGAGNSPSGSHSPSQNFVKKMDEWERMKYNSGSVRQTGSSPPTPSEDRLSADFRKKLHEWQKTKGAISNQSPSPVVPSSTIPSIPTHAQLSEDFRKKLEEWKRLKATNSVPPYTGDESDRPPRDHERDERLKLKKVGGQQKNEVLVQTDAGFFRFEGISRSFTRKLHEWEKSRGIGPEASTIALLRESLAKPPLPVTRTMGYGPWPSGYQKNDRGAIRLQRSQSVGSVRDDAIPHVSASVSSLSLTHLDECANNNENRVCDVGGDRYGARLGVENRPVGTESDSDGGPGAVLVEVEDEVEETAAPLVACSPCAAPQTPIYRYGQAQERHRACESTDGKLTPVAYAISMPPHSWTNCTQELQGIVTQMIKEEDTLQKLITGKQNVIDRKADVSKKIEEFKGQSSATPANIAEFKRRISRLEKEKELLQTSIRERIIGFNEMSSKLYVSVKELKNDYENIPESLIQMVEICISKVERLNKCSIDRHALINCENIGGGDTFIQQLQGVYDYIEDMKLECTKSNINNKENNLCITYTASKPKVIVKTDIGNNEILLIGNESNEPSEISRSVAVKKDKCEEISEVTCKSDDAAEDQTKGARRKTKDVPEKSNANNSKRKSKIRQRLEREKSLQSESDSEKEVNTITIEFPRRKKPAKSKSTPESRSVSKQNSFERQSNTDSGENVFVLTLKPKSAPDKIDDRESSTSDLSTRRNRFDSGSEVKTADDLSERTDSVEILISSIDIPPEGIEFQTEVNNNPDIFVKTTRRIFSPVMRDSRGETKAVIGFDLEEIANSISKTDTENKKANELQENLPDILVNNETKRKGGDNGELLNRSKIDELKRQLDTCESMSNIRSHSPSPLLTRSFSSNNSSKVSSASRNLSEESINQPKDTPIVKRGSGERFVGCKGSPILSRASTPGITGSSLPPLPASPPTARRDKPSKETAPSIRIMIQKYNMKLNEEGGDPKTPCGSSTPPWRSPRSQERFPHDGRRTVQQSVRNNPFFNREVQKSASASQIMKQSSAGDINDRRINSKENVSDGSEMTPPLPKKMLRGILKSSSAGSLKASSPLCQRKDYSMKCEKETAATAGESDQNRKIAELKSITGDIPKSKVPINLNNGNDNEDDSKNDNTISEYSDSNSNISRIRNSEESLNDNRDTSGYYGKKIDVDLLRLAKSSTCIPIEQFESDTNYVLPEATCSRAIKLKKAKEKFLASDMKQDDVTKRDDRNSRRDDLIENRLSQVSCGSDTSYEGNSPHTSSSTPISYQDNSLLMKSASVGMINVEKQAFEKITSQKGYESLPRNQTSSSVSKEVQKSGSRFGLSNLASKFRKVRMRSKNKAEKNSEKERLDTVTRLCRQSLLVNLHGGNPLETEDVNMKTERSPSQTDKSIFLAGKTGGAVAVNNEQVYTQFERSVSRSSSKSDNDPCCSKSYK